MLLESTPPMCYLSNMTFPSLISLLRASLLALILLPAALFGQATGAARLLGHYISPTGGAYVSGCWGWTDSLSGREYALLGTLSGTSIVEITDLDAIAERAFVPGPYSKWRELQTWSHYAYAVSEGGGGTQIIDLSYLPDSVHLVQGFIFTDSTKSTNRAHTIQIRDGYMYLNGCVNWDAGRGVHIFSLADPENPLFLSRYTAGHYIHDSYVRHDTMYACAINGIGVEIVDVTEKAYPQLLFTVSYPGAGTHNCATTRDGSYLLTTDEVNTTPKTLKIWDLRNPPVFPMVAEYVGDPTTIVHNVFVKETLAVMSYYKAGVKIVDIADPENPVEIGGYDTFPDSLDQSGTFTGAWSVYPYFPSGKMIIGDMVSGLYIIDLAGPQTGVEPERGVPAEFSLRQNYPNPFNPSTTIEFSLASAGDVSLTIYDMLGRTVATLVSGVLAPGTHRVRWDGTGESGRSVSSGAYLCRLSQHNVSLQRTILYLK